MVPMDLSGRKADVRYAHVHEQGYNHQPFHVDTIGPSVSAPNEPPADLYSVFVQVTDGFSMLVSEAPDFLKVDDIPYEQIKPAAKRYYQNLSGLLELARDHQELMAAYFPPFGTPVIRGGTCILAPSARLVHAGVGTGGFTCKLTGAKNRITFLTQII